MAAHDLSIIVRASDVLVVIVGHRYGSICPNLGISFTEAEYSEGFNLNKPCLVYMRGEDVPILAKHSERDPEKLVLLERWKATLQSRHTVAEFLQFCPVFLGSAYKNKGVQPLLDAVNAFLPSPEDVQNSAVDLESDEQPIELSSDPNKPLVCLAFKLEDGRYGQLTYVRVYQGMLSRGQTITNARTKKRVKVGRLVRMHASEMEEIESSAGGDLVALFGVDCASGDTFTDGSIDVAMSSMFVPDAVISLSIKPKDSKSQANFSKALGRFVREDPTFRASVDPESGETIISVWIVFIGATVLYVRNGHLVVDYFLAHMRPNTRELMQFMIDLVTAGFFAVLVLKGIEVTKVRMRIPFDTWDIPTGYAYAAVPVCSAVMSVITLIRMRDFLRNRRKK